MVSQLTTLILAKRLARFEGRCESAAIRHCAKRLLGEVSGDTLAMFKALSAVTTPHFKRVECVNRLEIGMRAEGLL